VHSKDISDTKRRAVGTELAKVKKADGCRLFLHDKKTHNYNNRGRQKSTGVDVVVAANPIESATWRLVA
jgi:hypothetical protein